jgi:Asp-tRNA(Asn)/Glu-tRNA(Gln) amidotransferase A subunit family amidase
MSELKESGRPFGICVLARTGGEQTLLRFMQHWEKFMPSRAVPTPLVNRKEI